MKKFFFSILFFCLWIQLSAQIEPVQSSIEELNSLQVRKVSSYYFPGTDTAETESLTVLEKEYDDEGKIIKKYVLSIWESVSNANTILYVYNDKDLLVESNSVREVRNLNERDDEYILSFGDTPFHEIVRFYYDPAGNLMKKEVFAFSTPELPKNSSPSQTVLYSYTDDLLTKEVSSSPNKGIFNHNFSIEYYYDAGGILNKKTMTYGAESDKKRITEYRYDSLGNTIEEKISDTGVARNNVSYRYEYNSDGLMINKLVYDADVADFVIDVSYTYDEKRNKISGDRNVAFDYYENGLICSELWEDTADGQVFYFVTKYAFQ